MKGTRADEREIWSEGFAHGQALSEVAGVCPYPHGSVEADAWLDGWYQGAFKTDGLSYRDGPVTEPDTTLIWRSEPCHQGTMPEIEWRCDAAQGLSNPVHRLL